MFVVLATGFDAVTGSLTSIDIRGIGDLSLKEKFQEHGPTTYCGIATAGFPNMFFINGPQAPNAFCNGPTCAELQGDWIADVMNRLRDAGVSSIVADEESEKEWVEHVESVAYSSLLPKAKSVSDPVQTSYLESYVAVIGEENHIFLTVVTR